VSKYDFLEFIIGIVFGFGMFGVFDSLWGYRSSKNKKRGWRMSFDCGIHGGPMDKGYCRFCAIYEANQKLRAMLKRKAFR
jgi:hypothetical protein